MATKQSRMHGRVEGAQGADARSPAAARPASSRRRSSPPISTGPGAWRFLCLDHVREHNAKYNFFEGMSADEIQRRAVAARRLGAAEPHASPPTAPTRRPSGATSPIRSMRSRAGSATSASGRSRRASARPSGGRCRCSGWATMPTVTRCASAIRASSAATTPTRTAATASHEGKLGEVIEAYQLLRKARGLRLIAVGCAERETAGDRAEPRRRTRDTDGWASTRAR